MLDAAMAPDVRSWQLGGDGSWTRTGDVDYQAERLAQVGEHAG
jgi:polyphosphate kinase